ncbi:MAG: hypothetical protein JXB32_15290 [Deltaproteobacteria bacterium]|nr:hypothetical protein [Deltaproteobacteria bacterium]
MEAVTVLVALGAVGIALAINHLVKRARRDRWGAYARSRGLQPRPGSTCRLFGVFDRTVVALDEETRSAGKTRYTVTKASAFFSLPMPDGLNVTAEGLGAGFAIAFGGQDIQVGHADADETLRIQASDEAATRLLFARDGARRAIVDFVPTEQEGRVSAARVGFVLRGFIDDPGVLDAMLRKAGGVVRAVESALAVDPALDEYLRHSGPGEAYPLPTEWIEPTAERPAAPSAPPRPPVAAPPPTDDGAAPPSGVDALVAELSAGGRVESTGSFTLDRDAARAKLARFRLRDPEQYVLALIRAAVLKGASRIDVTLDADDLRLAFDGRPFALADFEELYGALFVGGEDADLRARRQLALAVTTVEAVKPKFVRILSGGGPDAASFTLTPGEPDRYGPTEERTDGTTIHVKSGLLAALGGRRGRLAELLESRCAFATLPISVNGKVVSRNAFAEPAWGAVELDGPGFRGLVGLCPTRTRSQEVAWVVDGVVAARHELDDWPRELTAVVDGSARLKLDVSEGDVVRDAAHAELVAAVHAALPRVYHRLGEQLAQRPLGRSDFPRSWAAAVLRSVARGFPDARAFAANGPARWLAELPLFQDVRLRDVSLAELLDGAADGTAGRADYALAGLGIHTESSGYDELSRRRIVWVGWRHDPRLRAFLHRTFGDRLPCLNDRLLDCPRSMELLEELTGRGWL